VRDESAVLVAADDPDVPTPPAPAFCTHPLIVIVDAGLAPGCARLASVPLCCAATPTTHPAAIATAEAVQTFRFIQSSSAACCPPQRPAAITTPERTPKTFAATIATQTCASYLAPGV
jgi:hypothetical protein